MLLIGASDIMIGNPDPIEVARAIAKDIKENLLGNHLSTITYNLPPRDQYSLGKGKIPIFVVVIKFDSEVVTKVAELAMKWKESRIDGPFIVEQDDLKGIEDSIPEELWNVLSSYSVLEGIDVLKRLPRIDKKYLRAQAEHTIRGYIFKLRCSLPQVIYDPSDLKNYLNNLAFFCQQTIQLYHKLVHPEIRTVKSHLVTFSREFPDSWKYLKALLEVVYSTKTMDSEMVDLLTNTINRVLVTILNRIDKME